MSLLQDDFKAGVRPEAAVVAEVRAEAVVETRANKTTRQETSQHGRPTVAKAISDLFWRCIW
jgi:hypothetical protein